MKKKEYKTEDYRIIFGVDKITFDTMVKVVERQYEKEHKDGGRKDGAFPVSALK